MDALVAIISETMVSVSRMTPGAVFEPFFSGDGGESAGLGLYNVYNGL